jgi:hypothetical protein
VRAADRWGSASEHELPPLLPLRARGACSPSQQATHLHSSPQFQLVDKKELAPLDELNDAILAEDKTR